MITIQSNFDVHDIVQHKYSYSIQVVYEIVELLVQKCYAGVQVHLTCRPLVADYEIEFRKPPKLAGFKVGHNKDLEFVKLREDEVILCSEEVQKLIKEGIPKTETETHEPEKNI